MVTLGEAGAFVSHAEGALRGDDRACYRVPAAPAKAIDTTGAATAMPRMTPAEAD